MKSSVFVITLALAAAAAPAGLSAAEPAAAGSAIPEAISGRWLAISTTSMGITHDVELANGQFRTTRGAVAIDLQPADIPGFTGRAWIAPMDARIVSILANNNRLCAAPRQPEEVRWMLFTYTPKKTADDDDEVEINAYRSEAPPTVFRANPGWCGGLRYARMAPGEALGPSRRKR